MPNRLYTLAVLLTASQLAFAQKVGIVGFVKDAFTGESVFSTKVAFLNPKDSTVVFEINGSDGTGWNWFQVDSQIDKPGHYLMRFSKEGYYDTYKEAKIVYKAHRKTSFSFGTVKMRKLPRKQRESERFRQLGEAVITATKVKMVMKGDTVIYNADAFELAEGSMLDRLIDKLPGMRLDRDGQIFLNGEKVQTLLVNGEEFFRGDPKIALDNLPAYMVDKVKAYRKMHDKWVALGMDKSITEAGYRNLPLALDIILKKEYSVGWVANAEAGYGTDNHYMARLFALRFSPRSRLAFVGNANDVKSNDYYGGDGSWGSYGASGKAHTQEAISDYLLTSEDKTRFKLSNQLSFKRQATDGYTASSTTTFLDGGDVYSRSRNVTDNTWYQLVNQLKITFTPVPQRTYVEVRPKVSYYHYDNRALALSADFSSQLAERYMGEALDELFKAGGAAGAYRRNLISSMRTQGHYKGDIWNAEGEAEGTIYISPDFLNFNLGGTFQKQRLHALRRNISALQTDRSDRYTPTDEKNYEYHAGASYDYAFLLDKAYLSFTPSYKFSQRYRGADRDQYLLDETTADWDIDRLASTKDALTQWMDLKNSEYSSTLTREQQIGLSIQFTPNSIPRFSRGNLSMSLSMPLRIVYDQLDYLRPEALSAHPTRRKFFPEPAFNFAIDNNTREREGNRDADGKQIGGLEHHFRLNYKLSHNAPSLLSTLPYRDDATPLVVSLGNPALRDEHKHTLDASYNVRTFRSEFWNTGLTYTRWQNARVQAMSYDAATGVRTYQPDVINGNWQLTGRFEHNRPLDPKRKHWNIWLTTTADYRHSADLVNFGTEPASIRTTVKRLILGERVRIDWSNRKGFNLDISGSANWTRSTSDRYDKLSAIDYNYGASVTKIFNCGFRISTDARMYSRRGYSDNRFNTDQLIWNATVQQSALRGNLIFKLTAFDLLNRMSSYSYTVNAQMQQETYTNVLRRYVMLTVTWRLNREKKKTK